MTHPSGAATVAEAEAFLDAHPEIVAFDAYLTDANGIGRGKLLRRHEVLSVYRSGRYIPGSTVGLDVLGEDVAGTKLVWEEGDADLRAWPVPGSLAAMPWTAPPRGQFQLMLFNLDGTPNNIDVRQVLARQVALLAEHGLQPVCAFELEFYLLDREKDANGHPRAARLPVTGERPIAPQSYRLEELDRLEPFIEDVYDAAASHGIPLESMISEYALGQYEVTIRHRTDALRAADDLVQLKRLLRAIAARRGMMACFMAKPFGDRAGSGMHIHVSMNDADGRNVFADADGELASALKHAIGGLLRTMQETMLVYAPHLNSWRRFARHSYAPTRPIWGSNNRTVAVRVPLGPPENRHLEHRLAGVDCNPYLAAATVLAGIRLGLEQRVDPGPPVSGSGYDAAASPELPPGWREAIGDAERSAFLRETLGPRMTDVFIAIKRAEYIRFASKLTEAEYELLDTV